jgi:hypothetical protein
MKVIVYDNLELESKHGFKIQNSKFKIQNSKTTNRKAHKGNNTLNFVRLSITDLY